MADHLVGPPTQSFLGLAWPPNRCDIAHHVEITYRERLRGMSNAKDGSGVLILAAAVRADASVR
jgi:hypothetical protein